MKKFLKKILSVLLAVSMILEICLVSGNTGMSEVKAASNDGRFYRIFHLDAGRKYFSAGTIKKYIDSMHDAGLNQLNLYLSDNQGFRFGLVQNQGDTFQIKTANGDEWDLTKSLGAGWDTADFISSGEGYLTIPEMDDIISYANSRGIEIVPCINTPGHMGAILEDLPGAEKIALPKKDGEGYRVIDVRKEEARDFAIAIVNAYAKYFAERGCKYYNVGGDEYLYGVQNVSESEMYDGFVTFLNDAAAVVKGYGMTPRAFNDGFYKTFAKDVDIDKSYEVLYWDKGTITNSATAAEIIAKGHKVINAYAQKEGGAYYWVLTDNSWWNQCRPTASSLKAFDYRLFADNTTVADENIAGAMFCLWCDKGNFDSEENVYANTSALFKPFSEGLTAHGAPQVQPVYRLEKGGTITLPARGNYASVEEFKNALEGSVDTNVVSFEVTNYVPGKQAEVQNEAKTVLAEGEKLVIGTDGKYLSVNAEARADVPSLSTTTDEGTATQWSVERCNTWDNTLCLEYDGNYLATETWSDPSIMLKTSEKPAWNLQEGKLKQGEAYIDLSGEKPKAVKTITNVAAYGVTPAEPATADITFTAVAEEGATSFTTSDGVTHNIVVGNVEVVPPAVCPPHNLERVAQVDATTEAVGHKEHWKCILCNKLFADANGNTETTLEALEIPKLDDGENPEPPVTGDYKIKLTVGGETVEQVADGKLQNDGVDFDPNTVYEIKDDSNNVIATYKVSYTSKEDTSGGIVTSGTVIKKDNLDTLAVGGTIRCLLGDGSNYIKADGSNGAEQDAGVWTITKVADGKYTIKNSDGKYIQTNVDSDKIPLGNEPCEWEYNGNMFFKQESTSISAIGMYAGQWVVAYSHTVTAALPYAVESSGGGETVWTTTLTFTGVAAGTKTEDIGGKSFAITVAEAHKHTGGVPTCQGRLCEKCGEYYINNRTTDVDAENHVGPEVVDSSTIIEATEDEDGYTGDVICKACRVKIRNGEVIPAGTKIIEMYEHDEYSFFVPGANKIEATNILDKQIVKSVDAEWNKGQVGPEVKKITSYDAVSAEGKLVISDGTNYLACDEEGTLYIVTDATKATQWSVKVNQPQWGGDEITLSLVYNGYTLVGQDWDNTIKTAKNDNDKYWQLSAEGNLVYKKTKKGVSLSNGSTPSLSETSISNLYTPDVSTKDGTTVTIHSGTQGTTTFELDDITYTVKVKPQETEGKEYKIARFITNTWINEEANNSNSNGTYAYTTVKAIDLALEEGKALKDLLPADENLRTIENEEVKFWKGTYHPEGHHQFWRDTGKNATPPDEDFWIWAKDNNYTGQTGALDKTSEEPKYGIGEFGVKDYQYIRFWGNRWQVSNDRENWWSVGVNDQIVARYMQVTDVTEEITTTVRDWGAADFAGNTENYALLDFAVKYEAGSVTPSPDSYFLNGKTIIYETGEGKQTKIYKEGDDRYRWVDNIIAENKGDREVYMITLTPSNGECGASKNAKYTYNYEKEQIVWLEDATQPHPNMPIHEDFMWGEVPDASTKLDEMEGDVIPDGKTSWTDFPGTDGVPYVSHVDILNKNGMLVTYYIRAKQGNLNVHYWEWNGEGVEPEEFYQIPIISDADKSPCFDPEFAMDLNNEDYNLIHNMVYSNTGAEVWVTAKLEDLPAVPNKYKDGTYRLYMAERRNTEESQGRDVDIYYAKKSTDRYVVADFGLPLEITWQNVLKGDISDEDYELVKLYYNDPNVAEDENGKVYNNETLTFGTLTMSQDNKSCTYTPKQVFTGREQPIHLIAERKSKAPQENVRYDVRRTLITVHIVPATTVYYEPGSKYMTLGDKNNNYNQWNLAGTTDFAQQSAFAVMQEKYPYGYDPIYNTVQNVSAGASLTSTGSPAIVKTEFTGTGFELYANCTPNTGRIMVVLRDKKKNNSVVRVMDVDTKLGKGDTEEGTGMQKRDNTYNVPVVSLNKLPFSAYEVEITYYTVTGDERSDGVQIDGFRVTHPVEDEISKIVYVQNKESKPTFIEVRDKVLAQVKLPENWKEDSQYSEQIAKDVWSQVNAEPQKALSAIVVDASNSSVSNEADVNFDILDNGPKNEFYLKPGGKLIMSVDPAYNYQVGVKSLGAATKMHDKNKQFEVNGVTDMYYSVTIQEETIEDKTETGILTLENTGNEYLVITELKALSKNQSVKGDTAEQIFVPFTETSLTAALMSLNLDAAEPELPDEPETPAEPGSNEWAVGSYAVGDVRSYADMLWKCVQAHDSTVFTNIIPGQAPAFWIPFHGMNAEEAAEYVQPTGAHDAYQENEWCVFKGQTYMCKKANTVFDPETYPQGWKKMNTTSNGKGNGKKK